MHEFPDKYVFDTLLDGKVLFHKENYLKHAEIHPISRPQDRQNIQEALLTPDIVTKHDRMVSGKRFRHHIYYKLNPGLDMKQRSAYHNFWKVVIRLVGAKRRQRWCVVTAFPDAKPPDRAINKRQERVIYKRNLSANN